MLDLGDASYHVLAARRPRGRRGAAETAEGRLTRAKPVPHHVTVAGRRSDGYVARILPTSSRDGGSGVHREQAGRRQQPSDRYRAKYDPRIHRLVDPATIASEKRALSQVSYDAIAGFCASLALWPR